MLFKKPIHLGTSLLPLEQPNTPPQQLRRWTSIVLGHEIPVELAKDGWESNRLAACT